MRLLRHVRQKIHMSVFLFFFIYLFIGFDLENVGLASMEMVTELGLVVERTCFRGFRSDETSLLIFLELFKSMDDILSNYTIQAACAHQRH